jgi:xanthine dehydrogenase accessory factor
MTRQYKTWKFIQENFNSGIGVMLLYVLESRGSSPGRQGFFMAVSADGNMEGSIGGGIMEHKFVEMAKEELRKPGSQQQTGKIRKQVHDKSTARDQSGMICSGEQTLFFYLIREDDKVAIENILVSLQQGRNGSLMLTPSGIQFSPLVTGKDFEFSIQDQETWMYREKTGYRHTLFIIGGGHCALALSNLMASMDFYIRVFDDRKDLKTMIQNESANEKFIVNDYSTLGNIIPPGDHHYVIIMTLGYRTDDLAVRALLGKKFRYFGLLGSRSKVKEMMEQYRKMGIKEEWLQQVHAPTGLIIHSQTPEEIAVSIAAEIISIKNNPLHNGNQ